MPINIMHVSTLFSWSLGQTRDAGKWPYDSFNLDLLFFVQNNHLFLYSINNAHLKAHRFERLRFIFSPQVLQFQQFQKIEV